MDRHPHFLVRALAAALLAAGALGAWAGCTSKPTEIVSGVSTQIQVPRYLQSVGVIVQSGGRLVFCQSYPVFDGTVTLPSTLGAVPQEEEKLEPLTVHIIGLREFSPEFDSDCVTRIPEDGEAEVLVIRRRRMPYVTDRILYLPMPLRESCSEMDCDDATETCIGGKCEPMDIDSTVLEDYKDEYVFGNTSTCFSIAQCLPQALTVPAALTDPTNCTFRALWPPEAPAAEPGYINVRIVYDSFGTEVLDLDAKEGFVIPDPNDPLTFRLADNMCEAVYKTGRILAVSASPLCPAKPPLQPICDTDLPAILSGEGILGNLDPICTLGKLTQTESALYVLMERSASMEDFFGEQGLKFALETPLQNPIAARTKLAFDFAVPAMTGNCPVDTNYQTPTIGFDIVDTVREPIGNALADQSGLPTANDPLFLDAAMRGAYLALGAQTPTSSTRFNRRALLLIGNRDFTTQCTGGMDPVGSAPALLAGAALAAPADQRIHTYAVVVKPGATGTPYGTPSSDGFAIASAGGTTVYDASVDETEGVKAVNEIINDLGSCVYDVPTGPKFESALMTPGALQLSYLHPLTSSRTNVAYNALCNEASAQTQSGWSQDGQVVRICGQACDDLRAVLSEVALYAALHSAAPPAVPITASLPCGTLLEILKQVSMQ